MTRALLIAISLLVSAIAPAARAEIAGRASVIDGDTLEIQNQRIRLFGIDAPESAQTCVAETQWRCGQQAANALDKKIGGRPVNCAERDRDQYGRVVAVCRAGGEDLSAWLASEGWALAYRRYSTDYVEAEQAARAAHRGVWRGSILAPWDWRVSQQAKTPAGKSSVSENRDCRIKGNISAKGERIYHVPGGGFYEATSIAESKGERWFCTEAEAQAAGWRRSMR